MGSKEGKEYAILTEKAEGEITYLDSSIIQLMNNLNNISYSRYQVTIKEVNESEQQNNSSNNSESAEMVHRRLKMLVKAVAGSEQNRRK